MSIYQYKFLKAECCHLCESWMTKWGVALGMPSPLLCRSDMKRVLHRMGALIMAPELKWVQPLSRIFVLQWSLDQSVSSRLLVEEIKKTTAFSLLTQSFFFFENCFSKMCSLGLLFHSRMSWSTYYLPDKYPVDFDPPCPLVRDPANPGVNVADGLPYWGQFRAELSLWFKALAIPIGSIDS